MTYFVYQRKRHAKCVCHSRSSFRATGVWADDDGGLVVGNLVLDVLFEQMPAIEVVDGNVKEALILWVVQVERYDMIGAGTGEQVGNQCAGLCDPLFVASLRGERG